MHIEPGLVVGAKAALGYAAAAGAFGLAARAGRQTIRDAGLGGFAARSGLAAAAVFCFFEVMPHWPVGVSEVHLILGSTLFLIFGAGPAAIGLATGLLIQGLFFAPADLPQYGMNVATLIFPLFMMRGLAARIIAPGLRYADLGYGQALALSAAYQGGVVAWVAFWAFYGQGFGAESVAAVTSFGAAYMLVVVLEPLVDLAVLGGAKAVRGLERSGLVTPRLLSA